MAQYEVVVYFRITTDDPQKASDLVGDIISEGCRNGTPDFDEDDWEVIICKPQLYKEVE